MSTTNTEDTAINLSQKLGLFEAKWTPHVIAELNGQHVKLAKIEGELMWHAHEHEDELFMVLEGELTMQLRDDSNQIREVVIKPGEVYVVPRGVQHNPIAKEGTAVLLFEPAATRHTGEHVTERTVIDQKRI